MSEVDISKLSILIVEDNVHFRTLVRTILEALGVKNIEEARDGAEAMDVLKNFNADMAILDWKMDGINGVECVRRIRFGNDSRNKFLPIILCTGYTEDSLKHEARDAGANAFLAKPISAKSLLSRITSVMEENRPFVRIDSYFGPDRRRLNKQFDDTERRKEQPKLIPVDNKS
ncbi:MAG: hypothetical protein A3G18_04270 [Rhodospirillales bacterium RIFCSPLOWO2_12_FULL_58_28]|nr:MAG: hypothetical protein A3H92_05150 [Rhodospirillales bacterium RIFCSPLOWO2_02_FULL_58_16]OHC78731.1 MAG: hypothetical protein A3G18_04270 [Rhodospirillales bacterium RIFCSPLOWO2_12_FULL_58_28]